MDMKNYPKKGESQEICFIPDNDYRTFLAEQVEDMQKIGPGYFIDTTGKKLGQHKGFPSYTIGQRKGLGIALGQPMFVIAIHPGKITRLSWEQKMNFRAIPFMPKIST